MKVGFISLGCSKNLVDSEKIMGMLQANGHTLVHSPSEAEAIIINTCGFITSAKEEAISTIFEMARYKEHGLKKLIAVAVWLSATRSSSKKRSRSWMPSCASVTMTICMRCSQKNCTMKERCVFRMQSGC